MSQQFHCTFSDDFSSQLKDACKAMDVSPQQLISDAVLAFFKTRNGDDSPKDTDSFSFIDLFAGIGGFHQAMRYLGGECVMAAEINEECRKTYQLNYHTQEKELRRDVTEIDPLTITPFDVLCAGFPCQPFSKAGAQKGFQDKKRGNLFYTIMNILDAHPEVKFIILENVRNLADKTENKNEHIG